MKNIRTFGKKVPMIADSVYVDETALIIGEVSIQENASIWPKAVIRGDVNKIHIGKRTNIQDGTVIHVSHEGKFNPAGNAVYIGHNVTVAHRTIIHGCSIGDFCLIGLGSIIMDGVVIEDEVILAAGSLAPPGKRLEGGYLWMGSPVKKIRPLTSREKEFLRYSAEHYAELAKKHMFANYD